MSLKVGQIIDEYRIITELGSGGNGIVYRAQSIQDGRTVALKIPWKDRIKKDPRLASNFLRETSAIARLEHPNIAKYYKAGTYKFEENGESLSMPYITMELVEGTSFADLTKISLRQKVMIMHKVTEAVAYAHGKGVIHRDLKPTNIILDNNHVPKVLDFGLARLMDEVISRSAIFEGSPAFAAPEQFKGGICDERTDIWTLGAILFYLLCNRSPYMPQNDDQLTEIQKIFSIQEQVLNSPIPLPSQFNRQIDKHLDEICLKALAKDPKTRYQNAEDMATALQQWGRTNRDRWVEKSKKAIKYCNFLPKFLKRRRIAKAYQYLQIALSYANATTPIKDFVLEILELEGISNVAILEMPISNEMTATEWQEFQKQLELVTQLRYESLIPIQKIIVGIAEGEEIPHQVLVVYQKPQGQPLREQIGHLTTELAYNLSYKISEIINLVTQKGFTPDIPDVQDIFIQPIQILAIHWPFQKEKLGKARNLAKLLYYIFTGIQLEPDNIFLGKIPEKFRDPIQQAAVHHTIIEIQDFLDALERSQEARKILDAGVLDRSFLFPPGEYFIEKTLRIEKNGHLKLQGHTRLLAGPGVGIECLGQITAYNPLDTSTKEGNIYFGPMKIKEGWAGIHILPECDKLQSFEGCIWESGRGSIDRTGKICGGAIHLEGGKLTIKRGYFKDNRVEADGGAISINIPSFSELELNQVTFEQNYASDYGGAIAFHSGGKINISDCIWNNNRAGEDGGAISLRANVANQPLEAILDKCNFSENRSQTSGGAISSSFYNKIRFIKCLFESNQAEDCGGAIMAIGKSDYPTQIILEETKFSGNRCAIRGGAIAAKKHTFLRGENSTFDGNSSDRDSGGAISLDGKTSNIATKAILTNTTFLENRCRIDGGAVNANISTDTHFENCRFENNSAEDNNGGAIMIVGENAQNYSISRIINCNFNRNRCRMNGGAVNASIYTKTFFDHCRFKNNSAEDSGGACEIIGEEGNNPSTSEFVKVIFTANRCKMNGGAINAIDTLTMMFDYCQFENNRAEEEGGAFHIKGADCARFSEVTFLNSIFTENRSRQGSGALHAHFFTRAKIDSCRFKNNYAEGKHGGAIQAIGNRGDRPTEITFSKVVFLENFSKMDGGAIYLGDYSLAVLDKAKLERNKVEKNGGAIALNGREAEHPTKITFHNTQLIENHANYDGGAIYAGSHIRMILDDCRLSSNYSDNSCGAIGLVGNPDSQASKAKFTRVIFSHNHCKNDGGAIAAALRSQMIFEDCRFENNWSEASCGAIGVLGKDKNNLSDATFYKVAFIGNHCMMDGGALVIGRFSRTKFEKCIFEQNYAEKKTGGAILILGKDSTFSSIADFQTVIFRKNHCCIDGGAINANIFSQVSFKSCLFEENIARKKNGGAIVLLGKDGQSPTKATFFQVTFRKNQCQISGGAINANDFTRSHFTECVFEENRAQTKNGGAVLTLGQDSKYPSDVRFSKVIFRKNYCLSSGGAVNSNIFTISVFDQCQFEKNIAEESGGGIFIRGLKRIPNKATVRGCRFIGNVAGKIGADVALNAVKGVTEFSLLHDNTMEIPDLQADNFPPAEENISQENTAQEPADTIDNQINIENPEIQNSESEITSQIPTENKSPQTETNDSTSSQVNVLENQSLSKPSNLSLSKTQSLPNMKPTPTTQRLKVMTPSTKKQTKKDEEN